MPSTPTTIAVKAFLDRGRKTGGLCCLSADLGYHLIEENPRQDCACTEIGRLIYEHEELIEKYNKLALEAREFANDMQLSELAALEKAQKILEGTKVRSTLRRDFQEYLFSEHEVY